MTTTPDPDINGLTDRLNEARLKAHDSAEDLPSVERLTAFATTAVLIELTQQVHQLAVATREQTAELERARWRAEST